MIKRKLFFLVSLLSIFLFSCHDDELEVLPDEPDQGQEDSDDEFIGETRDITLSEGMERFQEPNFICRLQVPDGRVISRSGKHQRIGGTSILKFRNGLKDGEYRLLELLYPTFDDTSKDTIWNEYGLGCRIGIQNSVVQTYDSYNRKLPFFGKGTAEQPFIISSGNHLIDLIKLHNSTTDYNDYKAITHDTHFLQICDINMHLTNKKCSEQFGWLGIGAVKFPFVGVYDGGGYELTNMQTFTYDEGTGKAERSAAGLALFNYTQGASILNVNINKADIQGAYGVGAIVGGVLSVGSEVDQTNVIKCSVKNSSISGIPGSVGIGGMVGTTDLHTALLIDSCTIENTSINGDYDVGGFFGIAGLHSRIAIEACTTDEKTKVESHYSCAGGFVGASDSLVICSSINKATVQGATKFAGDSINDGRVGAGGFVGGTGCAHISTCINEGKVIGNDGVGGIVGSSRYGNTFLQDVNVVTSKNTATIVGVNNVGGICGEAQFSSYGVLNSGEIQATGENATVGGIIGNSSSCATHNAINTGKIVTAKTAEMVGGIVGRTVWGALVACQNYADINVTANYLGGIAGAGGSYSVLNYCANFGKISNPVSEASVGGIVGSIGEPKNWTEQNKRTCIITGVKTAISLVRPFVSLGLGSIHVTPGGAWDNIFNLRKAILTFAVPSWNTLKGLKRLVTSSIRIANREDVQHLLESNEKKALAMETEIKNELDNIRSSYTLTNNILPTGFKTELLSNFMNSTKSLLDFHEGDGGATINYKVNKIREDRYDEVEKWEVADQITHTVVSGVCWAVGTAISISGMIATAGGSTPATAAVIAGLTVGLINSANTIIANTSDFNNNADVVSQCVNLGNFVTPTSSKVGGIVGTLQNYGYVKDCLNGGGLLDNDYDDGDRGGMIGDAKVGSKLYHTLNLNERWSGPHQICGSAGNHVVDNNDNYQFNAEGRITPPTFPMTYIDMHKVGKAKTYKNWIIGDDESKTWYLKDGDGNYPLPGRSAVR